MTRSRFPRPALGAAFAVALVAAGPAVAEYHGHYGDVPYVTGGVTSDEADALRAQARDYRLEVTMATPGEARGYSDFVAGTAFRVRDAHGNVVAAIGVSGPIERTTRRPGKRYGADVRRAAATVEQAFSSAGTNARGF
jgi:DNA-binding IclR family transcriptional regulator